MAKLSFPKRLHFSHPHLGLGAQSYAKKHTFKKHDFFLKEEKAKIPSLVMLLKHKESTRVRCHNPRDFDKVLYVKEGSQKNGSWKAQKCQKCQKITLFLQKLQIVVLAKRVCFHPCSKSLLQRTIIWSSSQDCAYAEPSWQTKQWKIQNIPSSTSVKLARPGVSAIIYKRKREERTKKEALQKGSRRLEQLRLGSSTIRKFQYRLNMHVKTCVTLRMPQKHYKRLQMLRHFHYYTKIAPDH